MSLKPIERMSGPQLAVVESVLLGLRKNFSNVFSSLFKEDIKGECTGILLEAGYSTLCEINSTARTSTQLSFGSSGSGSDLRIETVTQAPEFQGESDVITRNPEVHIDTTSFPEFGPRAQATEEDLGRGMEKIGSETSHVWIVVCSASVYSFFQNSFPDLFPESKDVQPYFLDFLRNYNSKDEKYKGEEMTVRVCRVPSAPNTQALPKGERFIFAIFRPNSLQKQVEHLQEAKTLLEEANHEITEDKQALVHEVESLKAELEGLRATELALNTGIGEFKAERDLVLVEKQEVIEERDALKVELDALRERLQHVEAEFEALKEVKDKPLVSDESDVEVPVVADIKLSDDESLELGADSAYVGGDADDEVDLDDGPKSDTELKSDKLPDFEITEIEPKPSKPKPKTNSMSSFFDLGISDEEENDNDTPSAPTTTFNSTFGSSSEKKGVLFSDEDDDDDDDDSHKRKVPKPDTKLPPHKNKKEAESSDWSD